MTKLKDIELSALEEDIIESNITHVVLTKVADELASNYVAEHSDELKKSIRIDDNRLRERVLNKLADRIIGRFMGEILS